MSNDNYQVLLLFAGTLVLVFFLKKYFERHEEQSKDTEIQPDNKNKGGRS